ncbi:SufS family cysteine desulfurase [Halochromatium roseum]|uniref:SufS family cysteine desulfurase n=1 Tax=Halochromatium roseum TaxID=391920 RepID=UPI0019138352|nr:SufS family cysteine desulfurase [Halochromatium roseum]
MPTLPMPIDHTAIRAEFPLFEVRAGGRSLVFLDSAASTQQPSRVIETVAEYQRHQHANIHRAVYQLSQGATRRYEEARATVARFINAAEPAECLFTSGTTGSINLVAAAWGRANLQPGDEIILSILEHHSNIVPWQLAAEASGAQIKVIPINDAGELDLDAYRRLLSPRTRMVAVNHVSNALGTINPVQEIIAEAHAAGALALIDGAQWVAHGRTDVQALDADFYAFSGHKLYAPTGIGVLYGKRALLESMPPYQGGGDMIERVSFAGTTYAGLPSRFEAGTPNISGAIGLGAAIDWLSALDLEQVGVYEQALLAYATDRIAPIPGVEIKGRAAHKSGVISFVVNDPPMASLDVGTQLDLRGISVRTGHHCCQPLMERLGVSSTARASLALYNSRDDVDRLADALAEILEQNRHRAAARAGRLQADQDDLAPRLQVPDATMSAAPGQDMNLGAGMHLNQVAGAEPAYPAAAADSPQAAADAIAEDFALLPDWPTRHDYLIELGERLPPMPLALKTDANLVRGCQSTVYLAARRKPGSKAVIECLADSDAAIVRGLIALLQRICSGQSAESVLAFDVDGFFSRIGLDANLSLSRRNGLEAMVQRLKALARDT